MKNTEHGTNKTSVEMMHEVSRDTTSYR